MSPSEEVRRLQCYIPLFEENYTQFNRREFISPDPLETLYRYDNLRDREAAGLVVSSIAYGQVSQILKSASILLDALGPFPADFLAAVSRKSLFGLFSSFRHRFTSGEEVVAFLGGIGKIYRTRNSLEEFFAESSRGERTVIDGMTAFAEGIREESGLGKNSLLPSPRDGSACKRFFLYLKWMVRSDGVDPGGWSVLSPKDLILPLDVHMFRMCSSLGLTKRKNPDLKTALELTDVFRTVLPEDPVKYDFVLTRFGIRRELDAGTFVELCLEGDRK